MITPPMLTVQSSRQKDSNFQSHSDRAYIQNYKINSTKLFNMGMTNVKVGLSFKLIDVSGKKITWNSLVNGVSKMDTLEDVFRKQDEIVSVQNTKIMPYLKVDGSLITQVRRFMYFGPVTRPGLSEKSPPVPKCCRSYWYLLKMV
jgi:hypothetical protein